MIDTGITSPSGPIIQGRWFALRQRQVSKTRVLYRSFIGL